jgi:hypothetical protein
MMSLRALTLTLRFLTFTALNTIFKVPRITPVRYRKNPYPSPLVSQTSKMHPNFSLGEMGDQHRVRAPKLDVGPIFANKGYAVTWRLSKY